MNLRLPMAALAFLAAVPTYAQPLGTSFTYQGRLADNGTAATGTFDFQLILFDDPAGGSQVGPLVTLEDVTVAEGLFTVTLDFGAVFRGSRRWLQIGVRPGASTGAFAVMSPRQEMSGAPSSQYSSTTPWSGVLGKPAGFADDVDNDVLGGLTCLPNHITRFGSTSGWTCGSDNDVVGGLSCLTGQVPKFSQITGWACGADLNATYSAGTGISIVGTTIGIATSGVTSALIQDGTVAAVDLDTDSVTATQIAANAVGNAEMADNAIGSAEMADNAIGNAEMADNAIGNAEMADNAIGSAEIANSSVAVVDLNVTDVDARYVNTGELLSAANYGDCGTYSILSCSAFLAGQPGPACNTVPVGGICRVTGASPCSGTSAGVCGDGSTWYLKVSP